MNPILEIYNKINHFGNHENMVYEIITPGHVKYQMPIQPHHASGPGVAHGGIIAGFMDAILGVAALSLSVEKGNLVSTVEFKINYLAPVPIGAQIYGEGNVESEGNKIIVTSGVITDENGKVLAKAMGTFNAYPLEKIANKLDESYNS